MESCGFSFSGSKPDASILCHFRNFLVKHKAYDNLLEKINERLEIQGLKIVEGYCTVADASLVQKCKKTEERAFLMQSNEEAAEKK